MSGKKLLQSLVMLIGVQSFDIVAKQKQHITVSVPDDVKKLLVSIHRLCDQVMQKAVSSKESEDLVKSWNKQDLYHHMRLDLMSLNRKRYIQKLKHSKDAEDRSLYGRLKELYRELVKYDNELEYLDSSDTPSRKKSLKHRRKTEELLKMLEKHIESLAPAIQTFLQKHSGETEELAKQADEQKKRALEYSQQAAKRPVTEASAVQEPQVFKEDTQPTKEAEGRNTTYQDIAGALQNHTKLFPSQHEQDFVNFLERIGVEYPVAADAKPRPSNPMTEERWLHSKNEYEQQGFNKYQDYIIKNHQKFVSELEDIKQLFNVIEDKVSFVLPEKLQDVVQDPNYQLIVSRLEKYKKAAEESSNMIQQKFNKNTNPNLSPIFDPMYIAYYKNQHDNVKKILIDSFYNPILKNQHAHAKVSNKIDMFSK